MPKSKSERKATHALHTSQFVSVLTAPGEAVGRSLQFPEEGPLHACGMPLPVGGDTAPFSRKGLAASRMSSLGSSERPSPSSTMMANTMEAKLLSSFTWKRKLVGSSQSPLIYRVLDNHVAVCSRPPIPVHVTFTVYLTLFSLPHHFTHHLIYSPNLASTSITKKKSGGCGMYFSRCVCVCVCSYDLKIIKLVSQWYTRNCKSK